MREIKFRAWDNACNSMVMDEWKLYLNGGVSIESTWSTDDVDIMQYTGLKDKNGVEIYEGDIVRVIEGYTNGKDYYDIIEPVTFDKGCFLIGNDYFRGICEDYEVIGNIYENKELLNEN